jgi:3-hydroxybutyryl-CoA dehydratase
MTGQAMTTNGSAGVEETQVSGDPLSAAFDELRPGLAFASRGRTVTEGDIVSFAGLTGDWHPQHADATWAASSLFGERIAHGMLVVSYAIGLLPLDPERVLALRRVRDAVFKRPVRIGDTIDVEGRIAGVRELDQATGLVECDCRVLNQEGKLVVKLGLDVVWRRGDEAQPDPEPQANSAEVPEWRALRAAFLIGEDELCPWGPPL